MTTRNSTLVGVFNERAQAEDAIEQLHNAEIPDEQIRYSSGSGTGGGFLAGIKSLFTGEDTTDTGLVSDLTSMGLSQDEASYYDSEYRSGRFIVAVNAGDRWQTAQTILSSGGAYNYASRGSRTGTPQPDSYAQTANTGYDTANTGYNQAANTGYDTANTGYTTQSPDYVQSGATDRVGSSYDTTRSADDAGTDEAQRMRLREERLNVDKQSVQTGEARLGKEVVEEQQNIDVPVYREEVIVQRQSYDEGRPSDVPIGQDEAIHVPVNEEQVNVQKQTVETGEVALGKRTVQDQQRVSDTVRREEARLEKDGNTRISNSGADQDTIYNNPD